MKRATNRIETINLALVGKYDVSKAGDWEIGQAFGLQDAKKIIGLRIPDENEISRSVNLDGNATLLTYALLRGFAISLKNPDTKQYGVQNLPLTALVINGTTEIHAGPYYQIGQRVDWTQSKIKVLSPPVALVAPAYYNLTIYVVFEL